MEAKELVHAIIDLYSNARKVKFPTENVDNIRRGRSHSISAETEDLLANFLFSEFKGSIDKILVDQPVSLNGSPRKKMIYPDICLMREGRVLLVIDVKMDLGRKRDKIREIHTSSSQLCLSLREISGTFRDGITKEKCTITFSKYLKYFILVISKENVKRGLIDSELSQINFDKGLAEYFFLTDKVHPNHQDCEWAKSNIHVLAEFDEMLAKTRKHLAIDFD